MPKYVAQSDLTVAANDIGTYNINLPTPATFGIVCGFAVASTTSVVPIRVIILSESKTALQVRVRNLANSAQTFTFEAFYA